MAQMVLMDFKKMMSELLNTPTRIIEEEVKEKIDMPCFTAATPNANLFDIEMPTVTFNVFDVLEVGAFESRQCDMPYYQRRQKLEAYVRGCDHIKVLPILYHGKDTEMIAHHLNIQRGLGHEGVMINLAMEPYQFTRTNALLKVKVMQDCDLEIIGVQEGQGRFEGTLGALIVDYKGNPVGVGSGLSDEIRAMIWSDPAKYIGRVATIQYFEETNDADGKASIRFPVFRELREEGKEVSYS